MLYLTKQYSPAEQQFVEDVLSSGTEVHVLTLDYVERPQDYIHFLPMLLAKKSVLNQYKSESLIALKVVVPKYWEICMEENYATIWDKDIQRGQIFYRHKESYTVDRVEWWDNQGRVISCDYYLENGWRYKQEIMDESEKSISVHYYDAQNTLLMIKNVERGLYTLFKDEITHIYTEDELWQACLELFDLENEVLVVGNLEIADYLGSQKVSAVYSSKEPIQIQEVEDYLSRVDRLYIYHYSVFESLTPNDKIHHISPLYPSKMNGNHHRALIMTHTQEIEKIEEVIEKLPMVEFHIGALTNMGPRLLDLERCENVYLHPGISQAEYESLLEQCSLYLDINHSIEILNAVEESLEKGLLLFAFKETQHRRGFICPEHLAASQDAVDLIDAIKKVVVSEEMYHLALQKQWKWIQSSTKEDYNRAFRKVEN
ncbi:hypothetical protein [Streptococcus mitis]|uniref:GftB: Glycosyl transferase, family 8 n=1 Tax=Streptococcus mitis TaxID=28037 RepID=A0A139QCG4_STRMT|nr:hypothetical protein [Streptococcus mitis]KXU00217.1 GftB: Glycosyl transferase, family 8 [Streptococcus mitis]